ncbi:MAG: FecR domain-containing protein [Chloroflexi bacterium]|nr:FecR domain-containing protein [Chloroflexota bacterium]
MNSFKSSLCRAAMALSLLTLTGGLRAQTTNVTAAAGTDNVLLTAEGKVEALRLGATAWAPATVNQVLKTKDQLRTGFKSRATLRLTDQSVLRIDRLTTLEIQPPAEAAQKSVLDIKSGAAYFYNRETPVETQFKTPLASGAIRGTEFHLAVAEDGRTVLTLLDGAVNLTNELGQVDLASGEQGIVERGQPPRKTAVIDAVNIIQWALYYPGVLDASELGLSAAEEQALALSLEAYRAGELLRALAEYPTNRTEISTAERVYAAALLLAVGQVEQTEALLKSLPPAGSQEARAAQLAEALRELIATVKFQTWTRSAPPALATEWLAESYYQQSRSKLEEALQAARKAAEKSPTFGFAWTRVAELEFSFGRTPEALAALEKGLQYSPRNAQALALKGFLLAARNRIDAALLCFEEAIALDGALGNAWLGRGLCRIRKGDAKAGRADLQAAAILEPHRAVLRSYLGKAQSNEGDNVRAAKEIEMAKKLDPNDPTSWLYSALLNQQLNRINEGVSDLEKSRELNDNRRLFRSRLLLDQDRAVRSANLAAIYRDAGMTDLSVREASRAVDSDYANFSAHLFLANSYDALRDPRAVNLRYEAPWLSELLTANLLAPVGAGSLSQNISQQEYSKLLERDRLGLSSYSQYESSGDWWESASQFGTFGNFSYALDVNQRNQTGQRPNNDLLSLTWWSKVKLQVTPQDSLLFQTIYYDYESGDVAQYYNQGTASTTQRVKEKQEPIAFAGYHHEWQPGSHTLVLAGRLDDTLTRTDTANKSIIVTSTVDFSTFPPKLVKADGIAVSGLDYRSTLEAYSSELMHIQQAGPHTLIAGARFQSGFSETTAGVSNVTVTDKFGAVKAFGSRPVRTFETDLQRLSLYGYHQWQMADSFRFTYGLTYDRLHYPLNIEVPPLTGSETSEYLVSPKVGFIWNLTPKTHLRGAFTRSLGGVFFDTSVRLEPTHVAGFNQAFRSLIPESIGGLIPGSHFETWSLAVDHQFGRKTYVGVEGDLFNSTAERTLGVFNQPGVAAVITDGSATEALDYQEKSVIFTLDQLIRNEFSVGTRYRVTYADIAHDIPAIPNRALNSKEDALLHQLNLYVIFNHPCGGFAQINSVWTRQEWSFNSAKQSLQDVDDDLWQFNAFVGYRFPRRQAEVRVGVLNLTDRDYQLNPLTLYAELPRERTFIASLRLNF